MSTSLKSLPVVLLQGDKWPSTVLTCYFCRTLSAHIAGANLCYTDAFILTSQGTCDTNLDDAEDDGHNRFKPARCVNRASSYNQNCESCQLSSPGMPLSFSVQSVEESRLNGLPLKTLICLATPTYHRRILQLTSPTSFLAITA